MREPYINGPGLHCFTKASTSGYFHLSRNLAAIISLAVVFSSLFALSTQSVEAKTSRHSSRRESYYLVPPPPPYTPSMVPSALGMVGAQAVAAYADDVVVEKPVNLYSKYIATRNQSDMPQAVQLDPYVSHYRVVEPKILKQIDDFDSEISNHEKEIGKLLDL